MRKRLCSFASALQAQPCSPAPSSCNQHSSCLLQAPVRRDDPSLPPPWQALYEPTQNATYYWNPTTNITQYERPAASAAAPAPAPAPYSSNVSISVTAPQKPEWCTLVGHFCSDAPCACDLPSPHDEGSRVQHQPGDTVAFCRGMVAVEAVATEAAAATPTGMPREMPRRQMLPLGPMVSASESLLHHLDPICTEMYSSPTCAYHKCCYVIPHTGLSCFKPGA